MGFELAGFQNMKREGVRVVINQTLAEYLFPGLDPIGRRVAWTGDVLKFIGVSGEWRTVVGVVGVRAGAALCGTDGCSGLTRSGLAPPR